MTKWKKRGLAAGAVLLVAAIIGMSQLQALDVETVPVRKGTVTATVTEKGKIVTEGTVDIFSEVQGKVKEVYVDEGDRVEEGTLLAVIDVGELEAEIARLEGELKAIGGLASQGGPAGVEELKSALEQAKVALELAKSSYRRARDLYAEGAVTRAELEQAKAEVDSRQKAVDQAAASLNAARAQYQGQKESITAQLNHLKSQREKGRIVAGKTETVLLKKIKAGDYVTPGTLLFSLGNTGRTQIEAYVNSKDRANLRLGDQADILFQTPGGDFKARARLTKIAPTAEEQLSSLGIAEAKIKITLELTETPAGVPVVPGTLVDVVLVTQEARDVLAVAKEAVFSDKGKDFVWMVKDGKTKLVEVETGIEGDDLIEIKKGLSEGAVVLLNPHLQELKEGLRVK